jgi:F0F1-type ATP synthase assembly protein I
MNLYAEIAVALIGGGLIGCLFGWLLCKWLEREVG